jgi:glycosyltransferase involved in cell wall biosynthesis/Flp pilus assembly protein TadD
MGIELENFKRLLEQLKSDPGSFEANLELGLIHYKRGEIEAAASRFAKACEIEPNRPELLLFTGALFRERGDLRMSGAYLERAYELIPDDYDALYNLGLHAYLTNDYVRALELLEKAHAERPENYELLNDIGVMRFLLMDYDRAISDFERILEFNEDYDASLVNLGYVHLARGDLGAAGRVVRRLSEKEETEEIAKFVGTYNEALKAPGIEAGRITTRLCFSDQIYCISPLRMVEDFAELDDDEKIELSVIIPVLNEKDNIPVLVDELGRALRDLKQNYEILFVNDGSRDGTTEVLRELAEGSTCIKVIEFRRNYGQTAALAAGFKYCRGDIVVTMDGDLQNDPADIPKLLEKMSEGYDLVNGWRRDRKDRALTRKLPSWAANRLINKLIEGTGVQLKDFGCTLKAYKKGIVKNIHIYGEMHRFIPVFAAWLGVNVTEIPVNHRPRTSGVAKYGLSRVQRVLFDLIVVRFFSDYMTRPIQFFGKIAKKMVFWGVLGLAGLLGLNLFAGLGLSPDTIVILAALLLLSSFQLVMGGLVGELLIRFYFEGQKKDHYVVRQIVGGVERKYRAPVSEGEASVERTSLSDSGLMPGSRSQSDGSAKARTY